MVSHQGVRCYTGGRNAETPAVAPGLVRRVRKRQVVTGSKETLSPEICSIVALDGPQLLPQGLLHCGGCCSQGCRREVAWDTPRRPLPQIVIIVTHKLLIQAFTSINYCSYHRSSTYKMPDTLHSLLSPVIFPEPLQSGRYYPCFMDEPVETGRG